LEKPHENEILPAVWIELGLLTDALLTKPV
jgi:hypothetical protein